MIRADRARTALVNSSPPAADERLSPAADDEIGDRELRSIAHSVKSLALFAAEHQPTGDRPAVASRWSRRTR